MWVPILVIGPGGNRDIVCHSKLFRNKLFQNLVSSQRSTCVDRACFLLLWTSKVSLLVQVFRVPLVSRSGNEEERAR